MKKDLEKMDGRMSKALTPVAELRGTLTAMKPQFQAALPDHIPVDRFVRVLQTAVNNNPDLVSANRQSLFTACMNAAQDGLIPDSKESTIVTFRSKTQGVVAQYMPMIAGILKKARNSGEIASITSMVVYSNDVFKFKVDSNGEQLLHEPDMFSDRGQPVGAYAIARTKDDAVYFEIMSKKEIEVVKASSKGKFGPWTGPFFLEMWRKTVLKRLSKRLPMSTDLEKTMEADNALYDLNKKPEEKEVNAGDVKLPEAKPQSRLKTLVETPKPEEKEAIDITPSENTSEDHDNVII